MSLAVTVASGRLPQGSVTLPREVAGWSVGVGLYTPTLPSFYEPARSGFNTEVAFLDGLTGGIIHSFSKKLFQEALDRGP